MNIDAPGGTRASSAEQSDGEREKIEILKTQIADIAGKASYDFVQIQANLSRMSGRGRAGLASRYPELWRLLELGDKGGETAVEYDFHFKAAEIEGGEGTPAQKLEAYRTLLVTFEKIREEAKKAESAIT